MSFTINSTVPNNGVTEVALDNNIIFNFSDEVSVVSGKNITITHGSTSETVPVTDTNITHTGTTTSVNVFGEEVQIDANGQGWLSQNFNLTFDLEQSYYDGTAQGWSTVRAAFIYNQTTINMTNYTYDNTATDLEISNAIINTTDILFGTAAKSPGGQTNTALNAMTLYYNDPINYLIEINLPSGTKPQYSGANSATRTNDVTWRLSYCLVPGTATPYSTVLSGIMEDNVLKITDINGGNPIWYPVNGSNSGNYLTAINGVASTNNLLLLSNQITYNPTNNFSSGTQYTVQVDAGAFKNFSNNNNTSYSFSFTSLNTVTPTSLNTVAPVLEIPLFLRETYPLNDSNNIAFDTKSIIFEFSKPIYPKTGGTILIQTNNKTIERIDVDDNKKISGNGTSIITLTPETRFEPFTKYDIAISNKVFKDYNGTTLSFTTNDSILPTLLSHVPEQNASNVSKTQPIILTFSQPIHINPKGSIVLYNVFNNKTLNTFDLESDEIIGSGTNQITIKINKILLSKEKYYLLIASNTFHNDTNNFYEGITNKNTFVFKTAAS